MSNRESQISRVKQLLRRADDMEKELYAPIPVHSARPSSRQRPRSQSSSHTSSCNKSEKGSSLSRSRQGELRSDMTSSQGKMNVPSQSCPLFRGQSLQQQQLLLQKKKSNVFQATNLQTLGMANEQWNRLGINPPAGSHQYHPPANSTGRGVQTHSQRRSVDPATFAAARMEKQREAATAGTAATAGAATAEASTGVVVDGDGMDSVFLTGVDTGSEIAAADDELQQAELVRKFARLLMAGWEMETAGTKQSYLRSTKQYKAALKLASEMSLTSEEGLVLVLIGNCLKELAALEKAAADQLHEQGSKGDGEVDIESKCQGRNKAWHKFLVLATQAEKCFRQALSLSVTSASTDASSGSSNSIASIAMSDIRDVGLHARALKGLGVCLYLRGEFHSALTLHERALCLATGTDLPTTHVATLAASVSAPAEGAGGAGANAVRAVRAGLRELSTGAACRMAAGCTDAAGWCDQELEGRCHANLGNVRRALGLALAAKGAEAAAGAEAETEVEAEVEVEPVAKEEAEEETREEAEAEASQRQGGPVPGRATSRRVVALLRAALRHHERDLMLALLLGSRGGEARARQNIAMVTLDLHRFVQRGAESEIEGGGRGEGEEDRNEGKNAREEQRSQSQAALWFARAAQHGHQQDLLPALPPVLLPSDPTQQLQQIQQLQQLQQQQQHTTPPRLVDLLSHPNSVVGGCYHQLQHPHAPVADVLRILVLERRQKRKERALAMRRAAQSSSQHQ